MTYNIFISYSTKDLQTAKWLEQSLLQIKGAKVFLAHSNFIAGSLSDALINKIKQCNLFIVLYSKEAHASSYVQQEIGVAKGNNKIIIPVVIEPDVKPGAMLEGINYVKLYDPEPDQLQRLFDYVIQNSQESVTDNQTKLALGLLFLYLISKNR